MTTLSIQLHYVCINVMKDRTEPIEKAVEHLHWKGLPFSVRTKWDWYFKYREALLRVKYPRLYIDFNWGIDETPTAEDDARHKRNLLIAKKRTITSTQNKIDAAVKEWTEFYAKELFQPKIEEQEAYIKAVCKLNRLKSELKEWENNG